MRAFYTIMPACASSRGTTSPLQHYGSTFPARRDIPYSRLLCVVRMLDIAPDRRRPRARRQLRLRPNPSWDEQQLARGLAALHVGMGPGRIRQRIFATNPDSELPFRDPVKQLR
jgi:hypothetical protein